MLIRGLLPVDTVIRRQGCLMQLWKHLKKSGRGTVSFFSQIPTLLWQLVVNHLPVMFLKQNTAYYLNVQSKYANISSTDPCIQFPERGG